jgi:hypothetical protein
MPKIGYLDATGGTIFTTATANQLPVAQYPMALQSGRGDMAGITHINKFGHNPDIDTGTLPETIWDGGGQWVGPTAARVHSIVSSSTADLGTTVSSGTATNTTTVTLVDTAATFVSDGVSVNDVVIDTTDGDHSFVLAVTSETELSIAELHHNGSIASGNSYIVVTPGSTGSSVLHIKKGLDANKDEISEYIVMNGTTPVNTANSYWRISRMHFDGVGSGGVNVGNVTATAAVDSTVTAIVAAAEGQTLMAVYTIPKNKQGYLTQWYASIARDATKAATADVELIVVPYGMENPYGKRIFCELGLNSAGTSYLQHKYDPYAVLEAQTDIYVNVAFVSDSNIKISAGFDIILVDD